ncbi:hypothetical protein K3H47_16690, partial [Aeromonas veronii]|uniref:hypothetical protein n=1 Tax=Aeromonas veronii TaxID=654 RepID=UPI001F491B98
MIRLAKSPQTARARIGYSWKPPRPVLSAPAKNGRTDSPASPHLVLMVILTCFIGVLAILCSWKEIVQRIGFFHL